MQQLLSFRGLTHRGFAYSRKTFSVFVHFSVLPSLMSGSACVAHGVISDENASACRLPICRDIRNVLPLYLSQVLELEFALMF